MGAVVDVRSRSRSVSVRIDQVVRLDVPRHARRAGVRVETEDGKILLGSMSLDALMALGRRCIEVAQCGSSGTEEPR